MAKKNSESTQPWLLFLLSAILLAAGWLMKSFPVFIFFGFAPLFALADQAKVNDDFWINTEFILLTLFTAFFAAYIFNSSHLIGAIIHAIVFTLAFLAYSFAYQNLGNNLGKFILIFFWLGLEYALLKLPWRNEVIFLADAVILKKDWLNWTTYTGYLGSTLWILCTNLLLYMTIFKGKWSILCLVLTLLALLGPVVISYFISVHAVNRGEMITLYTHGNSMTTSYSKQGELIPRTAAWISVLILLIAFVKTQTKKK